MIFYLQKNASISARPLFSNSDSLTSCVDLSSIFFLDTWTYRHLASFQKLSESVQGLSSSY